MSHRGSSSIVSALIADGMRQARVQSECHEMAKLCRQLAEQALFNVDDLHHTIETRGGGGRRTGRTTAAAHNAVGAAQVLDPDSRILWPIAPGHDPHHYWTALRRAAEVQGVPVQRYSERVKVGECSVFLWTLATINRMSCYLSGFDHLVDDFGEFHDHLPDDDETHRALDLLQIHFEGDA